jgi:AAA15 family ATPase/GTPase
MLLQFVVENFLSFREPATLSMLAAKNVDHDARHCMKGPEGREVLRCAAVYGANASGKSNLVRALAFSQRLILDGTRSGQAIGVKPFKLDPACRSAPSRFELELGVGDARYSYGFEVTDKIVQAEWLFVARGEGEQRLFERTLPDEKATASKIDIDQSLGVDPARMQFMRFVAEGTRPNQLFLTEAIERNVTELEPFINALRYCVIIKAEAPFVTLAEKLSADESFRRYMSAFMQSAGTGIEGLFVELNEIDVAALPSAVRDLFEKDSAEQVQLSDSENVVRRSSAGKFELARIKSVHRGRDGQEVDFSVDEESDGTRRLMHLAPTIYSLGDPELRGHYFLIDELERSLHPLLTRMFLERFLAEGSPSSSSQLIFTTHDTNLLDLSLLSRDSIWFTQKDPHGASTLYSLAEFKAEQLDKLGSSLEKGYLEGRFGAIPFFGDPERLGWTKPQGS